MSGEQFAAGFRQMKHGAGGTVVGVDDKHPPLPQKTGVTQFGQAAARDASGFVAWETEFAQLLRAENEVACEKEEDLNVPFLQNHRMQP